MKGRWGVLNIERPAWFDQARCAGIPAKVFFPFKQETKKVQQAKRICQKCTVRKECLVFALENENDGGDGIFGGLTREERVATAPILIASGVLSRRKQPSVSSRLPESPSPSLDTPKFVLNPPPPKFVLSRPKVTSQESRTLVLQETSSLREVS